MAETTLARAEAPADPRESAFFKANMAAFRAHAPRLYARLAQVETPHSRLFIGDDDVVDIALGDRRFYGKDAVAFTQRQIDAYFAKPERRFISEVSFSTICFVSSGHARSLVATPLRTTRSAPCWPQNGRRRYASGGNTGRGRHHRSGAACRQTGRRSCQRTETGSGAGADL